MTRKLILASLLPLFFSGCALLALDEPIDDEGDFDIDGYRPAAFQPGPKPARIPASSYAVTPLPARGVAVDEIDEEERDAIAAAQARSQYRLEIARESSDVVLGMSMGDVRQAWGSPVEVDIAGDRRYGNERWTYSSGLPGWRKKRIVYFEEGRVAGWESR